MIAHPRVRARDQVVERREISLKTDPRLVLHRERVLGLGIVLHNFQALVRVNVPASCLVPQEIGLEMVTAPETVIVLDWETVLASCLVPQAIDLETATAPETVTAPETEIVLDWETVLDSFPETPEFDLPEHDHLERDLPEHDLRVGRTALATVLPEHVRRVGARLDSVLQVIARQVIVLLTQGTCRITAMDTGDATRTGVGIGGSTTITGGAGQQLGP